MPTVLTLTPATLTTTPTYPGSATYPGTTLYPAGVSLTLTPALSTLLTLTPSA